MRMSFLIILLLSALAYFALLSSEPVPDWLSKNFPQATQAIIEGRRDLSNSWHNLLEATRREDKKTGN